MALAAGLQYVILLCFAAGVSYPFLCPYTFKLLFGNSD
jgi:hypothetical protein